MGEVRPTETGSLCSVVAQRVVLRYRVEQWDNCSSVGSVGQQGVGEGLEQQAGGEAQRTKRTDCHMVKPDVCMGYSLARMLVEQGTEEVVLPNKGKDP